MKKKLLLLGAILICLAILSTGTMAYFRTEDIAFNVITSSRVDITLVEEMLDEEGNRVPFENYTGIYPDDTASKIAYVRNEDEEAWIRVRIKKQIVQANGRKETVPMDLQDAAPEKVALNINWDDWVTDGVYYYYTKSVPQGGKTADLFTEVAFDGARLGAEYGSGQISIVVHAQAVQTANNPIPSGGDVRDVLGWPSMSSLSEAIRRIFE